MLKNAVKNTTALSWVHSQLNFAEFGRAKASLSEGTEAAGSLEL
jgi:hypothetical protein